MSLDHSPDEMNCEVAFQDRFVMSTESIDWWFLKSKPKNGENRMGLTATRWF